MSFEISLLIVYAFMTFDFVQLFLGIEWKSTLRTNKLTMQIVLFTYIEMNFEIPLIILNWRWILQVKYVLSLYRWCTVFILVSIWAGSIDEHYISIAFQTHGGRLYMAGIMSIRRKTLSCKSIIQKHSGLMMCHWCYPLPSQSSAF